MASYLYLGPKRRRDAADRRTVPDVPSAVLMRRMVDGVAEGRAVDTGVWHACMHVERERGARARETALMHGD